MKRQITETSKNQGVEGQEAMTVQLPLLSTLAGVENGLFGLCVETGRQVLEVMMEQDRTALCGPKWVPNPERETGRGGSTASEVTLGGRRVPLRRPRVRSMDGRELQLPSFVFAGTVPRCRSEDPASGRVGGRWSGAGPGLGGFVACFGVSSLMPYRQWALLRIQWRKSRKTGYECHLGKECEHLAHRLPVHSELARRFPGAHPIDVTGTPNPCVQLH